MEPQQINPLNSERAEWPAGVGLISFENIGRLGVGRDGQLYWDGKPVQLRRRLVLSRWQKIGALIVGTAAVIGALGSFAQSCRKRSKARPDRYVRIALAKFPFHAISGV